LEVKKMSSFNLWLATYVIGPILGILVCYLEAIRIIKFQHFSRYPIWEEKVIIVSNHPSLLEPVILPLMGFPWMNFPWVFSPLWGRIKPSLSWARQFRKEFFLTKKLIPVSVPDKRNYYDKAYYGLIRGLNIPVKRDGTAADRVSTVLALKEVLGQGGRIILFPEGGRTYKAKRKMRSQKGNELGVLKEGAALLALQTGAKIVPIWVKGTDKFLPNGKFLLPYFWHRITINVGNPFILDRSTFLNLRSSREIRKAATSRIAVALLETADETG